jgi:hypothetical protein
MNKVDQFGETIPDDLVMMPNPDHLSPDDIVVVSLAAWYDADGLLLVSAKEIEFLSEDDPLDGGMDIDTVEIIKVSPVLHRWSYEDGFYHA